MKSEEVFDLPAQIDSNIYVSTTKEYRKFRKDAIVKSDNYEFIGDTVLTKMLSHERVQNFLADSQTLWRYLKQLIGIDKLQRLLQT